MVFDFATWVIFVSASLLLAFSPGPGMLYVLSRTLAGGRAVGIASTLGSAVGGLVHVFAAAFGVSAILASSALAFTLVKYLGAVFLIYLGLQAIYRSINRHDGADFSPAAASYGVQTSFYQGILSEVLNPKTAIFFLAFIPQFVRPEAGSVFAQFIFLGLIVVVLNALPDFIIACCSQPVTKLWQAKATFRVGQQFISGLLLIALGLYLAFSGSRGGDDAAAGAAAR
ncbi:MAG: LysE family translocator [Cellvibrionaceae bacterium]|nr:LysE family translocator [Cellvibrionaceae bacterium]